MRSTCKDIEKIMALLYTKEESTKKLTGLNINLIFGIISRIAHEIKSNLGILYVESFKEDITNTIEDVIKFKDTLN